MKDTNKRVISTQTAVIAGKTVKIASPQDAKASSDKVREQYSQALEDLKNR